MYSILSLNRSISNRFHPLTPDFSSLEYVNVFTVQDESSCSCEVNCLDEINDVNTPPVRTEKTKTKNKRIELLIQSLCNVLMHILNCQRIVVALFLFILFLITNYSAMYLLIFYPYNLLPTFLSSTSIFIYNVR